MGYADHDDLGIEGTRIFPALSQHPGDGRYPGIGRLGAAPPGHNAPGRNAQGNYAQAGDYPPGFTAGFTPGFTADFTPGSPDGSTGSQTQVMRPVRGRGNRERLRRMRPDRWIIGVGSITGAIAVYVAFTTAAVPARPMPSPFAPVTHSAHAPAPAPAVPPQMMPAAAATCGAAASGGSATPGH